MSKTIVKGTAVKFQALKVGDEIAVFDLVKRRQGGRVSVDKRLRTRGTVASLVRVGNMVEAVDALGDTLISTLSVDMGGVKIEKLS